MRPDRIGIDELARHYGVSVAAIEAAATELGIDITGGSPRNQSEPIRRQLRRWILAGRKLS